MKLHLKHFAITVLSSLVLSSCGGGGSSNNSSSSTQPPPLDTTVPNVTFSPTSLSVESGTTGDSTLTATDNVGVISGPTVTCTNGGNFDVTTNTFTAATITVETTSVCTATARDAAGNEGAATLTVMMTPPLDTTVQPPPPPDFSFDASVPLQPVLEGNIFPIEVSDSVVGNVEIRQISGPTAVELDNNGTATNMFLAPDIEIDVIDTMVFEVTGTSSGMSATVTLNVDIRGFAGPGKPVALFEPGFELLAGNIAVPAAIGGGLNGSLGNSAIGSALQFPGSDDNPKEFVFFGSEDAGFTTYRTEDDVTSSEIFSESSFFEVGTLSFNLQGDSGSGGNFVLLDEVEGKFRYFIELGSSTPFSVTEAESFDINNPCYVAERVDTGQDFIWVGQRNDGLSLIRLLPLGDGRFDTEVLDEIGDSRSLCHIVTTKLSDRISPGFSNDDSGLSDIITVDYDTNELVLYGDIDEDSTYDELEVVPIETQSTANLSIVDVFSRGTESRGPNYLVILLADNTVDGDHRLVLVAQNADDGEIVQTVYQLSEGIPIALNDGPYIGDSPGNLFERDIVVVTENSGAYVFEFINDPNSTTTPPTYGQPIFFDTGNGAGSAVTASLSNTLLDASINPFVLLVAYPETGLVRQFEPINAISD